MESIRNVDLAPLLEEVGRWAEKTFPNESVIGKIEHLKEELEELMDAPDDLDEWADCFLLLFDASRKQGLTFNNIVNAINRKYQKNLLRTWKQDAPGLYHHVKDAE